MDNIETDKACGFSMKEHASHLKDMLLHVCHDLENVEGAVSVFELPSYLEEFWRNNKDEYYANQLIIKKKEKYFKMKEELENLKKELGL